MKQPTAIIADDEAPLRMYLRRQLAKVWPELDIRGEAENGPNALRLIQDCTPDIAFLDIKMPGMTGLEVAAQVMGHCHTVFVTAYDHYAVQAFENAAVDYLLKPVSDKRLRKTISRLQTRISVPPPDISELLEKLSATFRPKASHLQWLKVGHGDEVLMLSVDEVDYFQAEDKYTSVVTKDKEWVIRPSIKELETALNPDLFWRIHRGTIVRVDSIARVTREFIGRYQLVLHGHNDPLTVSRTHAYRFKRM